MSDKKICSCGGSMHYLGKKFINISDTRLIMVNSIIYFEPVQMYTCKKCGKIEFYAPEKSGSPEHETYEQKMYNTYKDTPTAKLEKILEKDDYTDECKAVIRQILAERN